jgi:hypothetical protein
VAFAGGEDIGLVDLVSEGPGEEEMHPDLFSFSLSALATGYQILQLRRTGDDGLWYPVSFSPVMIKVPYRAPSHS